MQRGNKTLNFFQKKKGGGGSGAAGWAYLYVEGSSEAGRLLVGRRDAL